MNKIMDGWKRNKMNEWTSEYFQFLDGLLTSLPFLPLPLPSLPIQTLLSFDCPHPQKSAWFTLLPFLTFHPLLSCLLFASFLYLSHHSQALPYYPLYLIVWPMCCFPNAFLNLSLWLIPTIYIFASFSLNLQNSCLACSPRPYFFSKSSCTINLDSLREPFRNQDKLKQDSQPGCASPPCWMFISTWCPCNAPGKLPTVPAQLPSHMLRHRGSVSHSQLTNYCT